MDIPAVLGYGTNWNYYSAATVGSITEQFSSSASVDAYGTVNLPHIGQVQALRVNALTTVEEILGGIPEDTYYIREYYWLAPGIGMAAHILSPPSASAPPANFTVAAEVRRVFEANSVPPASNLSITWQKGMAILNWASASNASNYQVQAITNLTMTNWQILGSPATNSWSDMPTARQRFYRVFIEP
jgi:hypothetical protein